MEGKASSHSDRNKSECVRVCVCANACVCEHVYQQRDFIHGLSSYRQENLYMSSLQAKESGKHTHTYTLSLSQKVNYSLLKLGRNYLSSLGIYHLRNKHSSPSFLKSTYVCVHRRLCVHMHVF